MSYLQTVDGCDKLVATLIWEGTAKYAMVGDLFVVIVLEADFLICLGIYLATHTYLSKRHYLELNIGGMLSLASIGGHPCKQLVP